VELRGWIKNKWKWNIEWRENDLNKKATCEGGDGYFVTKLTT